MLGDYRTASSVWSTGCNPGEARWSRQLASPSRLRARLIWDVGEGCDSCPCSAGEGPMVRNTGRIPGGMNVPSGSLCLISLETVTPPMGPYFGEVCLPRQLGSGLLAVRVGLGMGWVAFLLARQLLGLQNSEMSQPQALGEAWGRWSSLA